MKKIRSSEFIDSIDRCVLSALVNINLTSTNRVEGEVDDGCGPMVLNATSEMQVLQSPRYPQDYPASLKCRWRISAPTVRIIIVQTDDIDIEESADCTKDRLRLSREEWVRAYLL